MKVAQFLSDSFRPHGLYSPWNSPGQNTGEGRLSFLQGIFLTQGSNPHCRQILYQLSHQLEIRNRPGDIELESYDLVDVGCGEKFCINFEISMEVVKNEVSVLESTAERVWVGINKGSK